MSLEFLVVRLACLVAASVLEVPVAAEQTATDLGRGPHLFVDDVLVARRAGLERIAHPCERLDGPVLEPTMPWESSRVYLYGSAMAHPHEEGFQLWYMSRGSAMDLRDPRLRFKGADLVLYATSNDGVAWRRPEIGAYRFDGNAANNIVYAMHSPSVLYDADAADPAQRYKMVGYLREAPGYAGRGYYAAHSPDGLQWTLYPVNPIIPGGDTITLSFNPRPHEYLAYFKRNMEVRGHTRRVVVLATSPDMQTWTEHGPVMAPDDEDDAWVATPDQRTDFYNMSVFPRGEQFLGMVTVFRLEKIRERAELGRDQSPHDGPIDVQLVHSRDGKHWERCDDRSPIIPRGSRAFDKGSILGVSNIPVFHDDEMWVYYTAMTTTHGGAMPEKRMSIGRASWRLDGMVSLDASTDGGFLETVTFVSEGRHLQVNANAAKGQLTVEVCNAAGEPIPSFTAKDCLPMTSDSVRHRIQWGTRTELPGGMPLRLRFRMRQASLYAFSLE